MGGRQVRLVLEYCDKGTMRQLLNAGCFRRPDGGRDLAGVVATALDVANAMVFLHENNVVHADLKARNVLLKSTGTDPRGFTAKVGDFGLSIRIDPGATHISNLFQGTMTHMAPETLDLGRISRPSDVYAFGILLYELYTGESAFKGVAKAMLGYEVVRLNRRPVFPAACPFEFQLLAVRCWESDPSIRPTFEQALSERLAQPASGGAAALGSTLGSTFTLGLAPSLDVAAASASDNASAAPVLAAVAQQLQQQQQQQQQQAAAGAAAAPQEPHSTVDGSRMVRIDEVSEGDGSSSLGPGPRPAGGTAGGAGGAQPRAARAGLQAPPPGAGAAPPRVPR
ncbi:putative serine/threonine-protein kinase pats1 [Monoraphidium neglectum]|uniref:Putative serine/threonine-protein kinase pats1 n=1 Tax=Monoraphidium neglectum TaxID=145388 RepID=A0A0D2JT30_9CHLO|nr:putative serine/threonine-protein kinase pats1 [Monoraphidium neglectum]KIZ02098.1 putative serine/threonine-protein kinase pats1 [Monoraphidium neglectum]|eukprot:XP_013901117.1 putative serine/threonine-protein kinase pats1 [Monoraphidium neglectum]